MERYAVIANLLTVRKEASAVDSNDWVRALSAELNVPPLRAWGITEADFPGVVEETARASSMQVNSLELTGGELLQVASAPWSGASSRAGNEDLVKMQVRTSTMSFGNGVHGKSRQIRRPCHSSPTLGTCKQRSHQDLRLHFTRPPTKSCSTGISIRFVDLSPPPAVLIWHIHGCCNQP
jgi:hypothetical protein